MAESSFPIKELPMTDLQWGQVTSGMGSGVLGQATGNYALGGLDNALNTAKLQAGSTRAEAIVSGFYHRIDADQTISLPAVTSTTTYYVGLLYDSSKHASASGPVSISVTTSKPSGAGKVYLPLYEVVRSANQLLSDATIRVRRVLIAPTLSVASIEELPDPASMMQGTLCQTSNLNMLWRVSGSSWVPVGAVAIASPATATGWTFEIPAGGIELQYREDGRRMARASDVVMRRTGASFTQGTSYQVHGTFIPPSLRGASTSETRQYQATLALNAATAPGAVRLNIGTGALEFRLASGSQVINVGHEVLFSATWLLA